jgi:hypothetical protein
MLRPSDRRPELTPCETRGYFDAANRNMRPPDWFPGGQAAGGSGMANICRAKPRKTPTWFALRQRRLAAGAVGLSILGVVDPARRPLRAGNKILSKPVAGCNPRYARSITRANLSSNETAAHVIRLIRRRIRSLSEFADRDRPCRRGPALHGQRLDVMPMAMTKLRPRVAPIRATMFTTPSVASISQAERAGRESCW